MSVVVSTPAGPDHDPVVHAAADRLIAAEKTNAPCPPVRDLIGRDDVVADIEATRAA
jgi:hypothetical protein